jgi:phosphoglycolate phosphatase
MTLQKPTIVLFDMDGTTVRHINPRLLQVLEWADDLSHKGARFFSKLLRRRIDVPPLVEHRHGKRPKVLVQRAMHKMRRKEVGEIVEPCPGIYAVLDLLQSHGVRMGIISNGLGKGYGHDILQKFDLEKYYEAAIFREDIRRPKPYPDPILQALEAMNPRPGPNDVIWYFGDRRKDILAALAAREHLPCPLLPFAYNLHAAVAVLEHNIGADHIFMAWPDLEPKLRRILEE